MQRMQGKENDCIMPAPQFLSLWMVFLIPTIYYDAQVWFKVQLSHYGYVYVCLLWLLSLPVVRFIFLFTILWFL